jgi:hypothetical protein
VILGEGIRHDQSGAPFNAIDPVSRTPTPVKRSELDLPAMIDGRLQVARASGADTPPSPADNAVQLWDGKSHTGSFARLDDNTAAQHVGRGQYQVYDVSRDLGGAMPSENVRDVAISARGQVDVPQNAERSNER